MSASLLSRSNGSVPGAAPFWFIGSASALDRTDGQSRESGIIFRAYERIANDFCRPVSRLRCDPVRKFYDLLWTWSQEVHTLSDIDAVCTHPAYQQIIGMGETSLPFIFAELQRGEAYWFWALKAISGEDPISEENRGRITLMKQGWLKWGREHGYI